MATLLSSTLRWSFFVLVVTSGAGLHAAFELTGEAIPAGAGEAKIAVLRESLEERASVPVGTAQLADGRFKMTVNSEAGLFNLQYGEAKVSFVATDGQTLQVSATEGGKLRVTGAPDQALYEAYETFRLQSLAKLVTPARAAGAKARTAGDDAEVARQTEAEVSGYIAHRHELNSFTVDRLQGSPVLYAASLRWDGDYRLDELAREVEEFSRQHLNAEISRLMTARIARFRATAIGALAPALVGPAPDGANVALTDLRGQVVLVDFWASWCGPCRMENRHYVELYQRYHAAGFEILAVSVDQSGPAWKAGIAKDGAVWRHISDLKAWKTPLAAAYNVTALPASFLLDREGRIIAKDARGPQLDALLAAQLGKTGGATVSQAAH